MQARGRAKCSKSCRGVTAAGRGGVLPTQLPTLPDTLRPVMHAGGPVLTEGSSRQGTLSFAQTFWKLGFQVVVHRCLAPHEELPS